MPLQSPFESLPRHIATAFVLPYVTSSDWLNFRLASRSCYTLVHGSADDVSQFFCPTCHLRRVLATSKRCDTITNTNTELDGNVLSDNLWKLALVRDFHFEEKDDFLDQSIHSPIEPVSDAFVSTQHIFTASNLFVSWMHWRRLNIRIKNDDDPPRYEFIMSRSKTCIIFWPGPMYK